jgi:molybdopterin molybdotransferase
MSFLTTDEARQQILEEIGTSGHERVSLGDAPGRILTRDIPASADAPRFSNSARDGYAFRFEDLDAAGNTTLEVTQTVHAGEVPTEGIGEGQAAKIMTGAPVPEGADTIVMREFTEEAEGSVTILEAPPEGKGAWVRAQGSFVKKGAPLLAKGQRIGAGDIGALAGNGTLWVQVARKPVVAIICAGDELVDPGQEPGPGQIINANSPMLEALVRAHGGHPIVYPTLPDNLEVLRQTYEDACACADLVISSGGVSMGDRDFTRQVLEERSGGMKFWKIAMKPGKPLAFGVAKDGKKQTPLIGLPGNPASSLVCFHQFVKPALARLQGVNWQPAVLEATTTEALTSTPKRQQFITGQLTFEDAKPRFTPIPDQDSGNPAILANVNAFAIVDQGIASFEANATILVEMI